MKKKFFSKKFLAKVFIIQACCLLFLVFVPVFFVNADLIDPNFKINITIPGSEFKEGPLTVDSSTLAKYIAAWYKFAIAAIGVLATVMIMAGGLIWLTAGGNQSQISTAKDWITGAFSGMVIALLSYTVLEILNPSLVNLKSIDIKPIVTETFKTGITCCNVNTGEKPALLDNGLCPNLSGIRTCFDGTVCQKEPNHTMGNTLYTCLLDPAKIAGCCLSNYIEKGTGVVKVKCTEVISEDKCNKEFSPPGGFYHNEILTYTYRAFTEDKKKCIDFANVGNSAFKQCK